VAHDFCAVEAQGIAATLWIQLMWCSALSSTFRPWQPGL
jgi:hypothetical protein